MYCASVQLRQTADISVSVSVLCVISIGLSRVGHTLQTLPRVLGDRPPSHCPALIKQNIKGCYLKYCLNLYLNG